jgi:hypothetical protein
MARHEEGKGFEFGNIWDIHDSDFLTVLYSVDQYAQDEARDTFEVVQRDIQIKTKKFEYP